MARLSGTVAVITGGGSEPGLGIALRFAREGATVVVIEGDGAGCANALAELRAVAASAAVEQVDLAQKTPLQNTLRAIAQRCGRIDILVNAAQVHTPWLPLEQKTDAMFAQTLDVGLYGALWAMQAVLPVMRAQGGGRIINIGSIYGDNVAEYIGDYTAATDAVKGLTRTAAMEWGRDHICVNMLMPTVDSAAFRAYCARHAEAITQPLELIPLGRFGDPQRDIGGAALFLAGEHGRYITGQIVHADGGYHMAGPVYVPRLGEQEMPR